MSALFLAFDTSTLVASVAVASADGSGAITPLARAESSVKNHSQGLVTLIDRALAEAGVSADGLAGVAVGAGPGSFTGLRIGMATAKGLCFATGAALWSISSLAALARDIRGEMGAEIAAPILDARRGEVFFGVFDVRGRAPEAIVEERVAAPADAAAQIAEATGRGANAVLAGDGAALYAREFEEVGRLAAETCRSAPSAVSIAALAADSDPEASLSAAVPKYLRPSEAERKYPQGNPGGSFSRRRAAPERT